MISRQLVMYQYKRVFIFAVRLDKSPAAGG